MAGSYPDAPGPRMYYERDGSVVVNESGTAFSAANTLAFSDETDTNVQSWSSGTVPQHVSILFPELRDINGYFWVVQNNAFTSSFAVSTSVNTTNGVDGTWVVQNTAFPATQVVQSFRNAIIAASLTGIKGIRFAMTGTTSTNGSRFLGTMHVYGSPSTGQNVDRLRIWHPTLDQQIGAAAFDYADAPRGFTYDKTFRIKNNSATLTANSVALSVDALTDTSPTVVSQFTISQGGAFAATQNLGNLAVGAISAVCTLRLILLSNATVSLWRQRLTALAGSWT